MIKELAWYLDDNRFSTLTEELTDAITQYDTSKKNGDDDETQTIHREKARSLFEEHCVKSGLRSEEFSYINIDNEFYNGSALDEKAVDDFIKNIIKGHCYQKVLWTYMGTTGNFTQISKSEMKKRGLDYENYLPIDYKKEVQNEAPLRSSVEKDTALLYLYTDGTVSETYYSDKAKYSFDALKDTSGFDWSKGYDPNDMIEKKDWYGCYDKDGYWTKVDTVEDTDGTVFAKKVSEIRLLKHGDTCILYDPGMTLLNGASLYYLTEEDEVYGNIEQDSEKTALEIQKAMVELGVNSIDVVAGIDTQNTDSLTRYKALLGNALHKDVQVVDSKEALAYVKEVRLSNEQAVKEKNALALEKRIHAIEKIGGGATALQALTSGKIRQPLSVYTRSDAQALSLTEHEIAHIQSLPIKQKNKEQFNTVLSNVYAQWPVYSGSGIAKTELADMVYEYLEKGVGGENLLTAETALQDIVNEQKATMLDDGTSLFSSGIPGVFAKETNVVNFYNASERSEYLQTLENKAILPEEGAQVANALLQELPKVTAKKQENINRALTHALGNYTAIAMSSGMPLKEVVDYALSKGEKGIRTPIDNKSVYYEVNLQDLVTEAEKENLQTKEASLTEILPVEQEEVVPIVVGGSGTQTLQSVSNLHTDILETQYGYTAQEAKEIEQMLGSVQIQSPKHKSVQGLQKSIVKDLQSKQSVQNIEKHLIQNLSKSDGVTYNLTDPKAYTHYIGSERFKNSGMSELDLQDLLESSPTTPAQSYESIITPQYREAKTIVPLTRTMSRGSPMPIRHVRSGTATPAKQIQSTVATPRLGSTTVAPIQTKGVQQIPSSPTAYTMGTRYSPRMVSLTDEFSEKTREVTDTGSIRNDAMPIPNSMPIHRASTTHTTPKPRMSAEEQELNRLKRIEQNYLEDKAMLQREASPVLARSASHDIGHADEEAHSFMADEDDVKRMSVKLSSKIANDLDGPAKGNR